MVAVLGILGLASICVVNSILSALLTRILREHLPPAFGISIAVLVCPFVALAGLLVLSGPLPLGSGLELTRGNALFVGVLVPVCVGITVDVVWMPSPTTTTAPERLRER